MVIRISDNWGEAKREDIVAVFQSAASELIPYFDGLPDELHVFHWDGSNPMMVTGQNVMLLTARDKFWNQYAYQFAHEFCHLATRFDRLASLPSHSFIVDEILCEAASLFVLHGLSKSWAKSPPYANWRSFAPTFAAYADSTAKAYQSRPSVALDFDPITTPYNRQLNGYFAARLLPLLLKAPHHWSSAQVMPQVSNNLSVFFAQWLEATNRAKFVTDLVSYLERDMLECGFLEQA